jgi:hypothetical protein|tara:strand:- start:1324 stop:1764 length:441 start_codon:yes stop_codon:yes gene_type:complete
VANKFQQGPYVVLNPNKYAGKGVPKYRSGWELAFMRFCDSNDHIISWSSESLTIPYRNPLTGKPTRYIPDFLIQYRNKHNQVVTELIEIKPKKQSILESKASNRDRAIVAVNYAKWAAAQAWCKRNGLTFRVITEDDIFRQGGKRR